MTQRSAHTHNCKDCQSLAAFVCKLDFPEELALCNLDKAEQVRFFRDANTFKVGGKLELSSIRTWYERYLTATYERWSAQKRRSVMKPLSVWAGEGYKTAGIEKNAEREWDETLEEYTYALPVKEKEVGELQRRAAQEAMKIVRRGRKTRGDAAAAAAALPPQDGSLVPSGGAADQAPSGGAAEPAAGAEGDLEADMANFMDLVSSSSEAEKNTKGKGKPKPKKEKKNKAAGSSKDAAAAKQKAKADAQALKLSDAAARRAATRAVSAYGTLVPQLSAAVGRAAAQQWVEHAQLARDLALANERLATAQAVVATLGRNSAATNLCVNYSDKEVAAHVKTVKELLTQLRKRKAAPKAAGKARGKPKAKAKAAAEEPIAAPGTADEAEEAEDVEKPGNEDERD